MVYAPSNPRADEPFFALLGRDDSAPKFARAYGYLLQGQIEMAMGELAKVTSSMAQLEPMAAHHPKVRSCFEMADEMDIYRRNEIIRHGVG